MSFKMRKPFNYINLNYIKKNFSVYLFIFIYLFFHIVNNPLNKQRDVCFVLNDISYSCMKKDVNMFQFIYWVLPSLTQTPKLFYLLEIPIKSSM